MAAAATASATSLSLLWAQCTSTQARSLCDVRITAKLFAHSYVLASASPVLASALASQRTPSHLTNSTPIVLRSALALIYGEQSPSRLNALSLDQLIELAHLIQSLSLDSEIAKFVDEYTATSRVNTRNAMKLITASNANNNYTANTSNKNSNINITLPASVARAKKLLMKNFSTNNSWKTYSFEDVESLLRIHELVPNNEEEVFRALERWVSYNPKERKAESVKLLRLIRFPTMSDRMLLRVARSPYFASIDEFYQLLLEAFIRRADVRLVQANKTPSSHKWKRTNMTDNDLGINNNNDNNFSGMTHQQAYRKPTDTGINKEANNEKANLRENRTVLFEGLFPLKWYKNMRFRTRSARCMLFTFVITKWSQKTRRVRSESRPFADKRWSLWIDPYANIAASGGDEKGDENDYVSLFLCCDGDNNSNNNANDESNFGEIQVDYSLFLVHSEEEYGMERKVCTGRSFSMNGQAMGFRRHTKRKRLFNGGFYNPAKDELIVGAQIVLPDMADAGVQRPESSPLAEGDTMDTNTNNNTTPSTSVLVTDNNNSNTMKHHSNASSTSPVSWLPNIRTDILRDLPRDATLNPAAFHALAISGESVVRGASAVSDATAAEVVRNLSNPNITQ